MSESTNRNAAAADLEVASDDRAGSSAPEIPALRPEALDPPEGGAPRPVLTLVTADEDDAEGEDDLLSLVETEAAAGGDEGAEGDAAPEEDEAPSASARRAGGRGARPEILTAFIGDEHEDVAYRFPYSRAVLEIVPDMGDTFGVRLAWHRGKATLPVVESTALRPVAEVTRAGQKYPIFLSQHARKRRDRVVLGGKRKAAKSWRCALRCATVVQGRGDRFSWLWRVTATAPAMALPVSPGPGGDVPEDAVMLALPLSPAKQRTLTIPGLEGRALVVWMHDIALSVVAGVAEADGASADGSEQPPEGEVGASSPVAVVPLGVPVLSADARGVYLHLRGARLGVTGTVLRWETWLTPARSEAEALAALLQHVADAADRAQTPTDPVESAAPFLNRLADDSAADLMREDRVDKRGVDKQLFRAVPGKSDLHLYGTGADAALAAATLVARFRMTGDDALRRRARLLTNGLCEAQINVEGSPHWGAIWDAFHRKKVWGDAQGAKTLAVATTARAAKGLHLLHAHFEVELYQRTALHAAQWLLLKMDPQGRMAGERFAEEGAPVVEGSPWTMVETLTPLVETFRATGNEVFLKAAMRVVNGIREGLADASLPFSEASTEHLAAAIEGVLLVSREYENEEMIALASQLGLGLRGRRLPDGTLGDPTGGAPPPPLCAGQPDLGPTLAGARAALALARVDDDPRWPLLALRALRAARRLLRELSEPIPVALLTYLTALPTNLLLTVAQRAANAQADLDLGTVTRAWQTFGPDPATNEYVRVFAPGTEEPLDHLALVCPVTQQVLISVVAPPGMETVDLWKNGRRPFVRGLLSGDYDAVARTVPLGDGAEARAGVYLADT